MVIDVQFVSLHLNDDHFLFVAPTCRKEQVREHYSENGCKSRKPLKMAKCVGSCGSSCCHARKSKRRKVSNGFLFNVFPRID